MHSGKHISFFRLSFGRPTVGRVPSGRRTMNQLLSDYDGCFQRLETFVAFVLAALRERDFNSEGNFSGIPEVRFGIG